MTMRERMAAGELFTDECEGLLEERIQAKKRMKAYNDSDSEALKLRADMLREMLGEAEDILVEPPFYFCYGTHIFIGTGSFINFNCNFLDDGIIRVGKNVLFGPAVTIATVGHPVCPELRKYMYTASVTVCLPVRILKKNLCLRSGSTEEGKVGRISKKRRNPVPSSPV